MTVHDLDQRLRMLAEEGARLASAPGIEAALRRGRQRRRHLLAACAAVLAVAIAGGGFGVRSWLDPATDRIAATPPVATIPEDTQRGLEVRKVSRPAADTITIEGTMNSVAWRYTLDREQSQGQQVWADSIHFQNGEGGKAVGLFLSFPRGYTQDSLNGEGLEFLLGPVQHGRVPVYLQVENASSVDQQWDRLRIAKVTKQAAVLQVTLQRGSEGLPPVEVQPIPGGAAIPWNLAVFKLPAGAAATKLALLDSQGRRIASATS